MNFLSFAEAHGLDIRSLVRGRISRCPTKDHPAKQNGAYLFDGNWGWAQNWASMLEPAYWHDAAITKPDDLAALRLRMAESRRQQEKQREADARRAAEKAAAIIRQATAGPHSYLENHGIKDHGLTYHPNETTELLVIPMRIGKDIAGCQLIGNDGGKKFIRGQRTNDAEHVIGSSGVDLYVEGYCTGLAVYKSASALKMPVKVHVCFSAGNLKRMATNGLVVADHDTAGIEAASGRPYYLPEEVGTDFCDEWQRIGTLRAGLKLQKFILENRRKCK